MYGARKVEHALIHWAAGLAHGPLPGPLLVFLRWANYFADHPKRDWPDILGGATVPLWVIETERWLDGCKADGARLKRAMNQP